MKIKNRICRRYPQLNKCPDRFIKNFSSFELKNMTQWVSCRFSPSKNYEHLMAMGDEEGFITIADARQCLSTERLKKKSWTFHGDKSVIMDCCFMNNIEHCLVTVSGSSHVRIWDLETQKCVQYVGHEMSVRGLAVSPDNPFCLITGGRDGTILIWDTRTDIKALKNSNETTARVRQSSGAPFRKYVNAHLDNIITTSKEQCKQKRMKLSLSGKKSPVVSSPAGKKVATITAILAADRTFFLSASSSSRSGIRLWDIRYQHCSKPVRIFEVPKKGVRDCGMTSMCWDRFCSKFYATCTDNCIYEFALWDKTNLPIETYTGVLINSFYIQCVASPFSDHLICGSSYDYALMWDLQENQQYVQDPYFGSNFLSTNDTYYPFPKYKFGGHKNEVFVVRWNSNGHYLVTMDEDCLRIWHQFNDNIDIDEYESERIIDGVPQKIVHPTLLKF